MIASSVNAAAIAFYSALLAAAVLAWARNLFIGKDTAANVGFIALMVAFVIMYALGEFQ